MSVRYRLLCDRMLARLVVGGDVVDGGVVLTDQDAPARVSVQITVSPDGASTAVAARVANLPLTHAPLADEDHGEFWAKRVLGELVQYMRMNKDLARAGNCDSVLL